MNDSKQTATQVVGVDIAKRVFQLHWIDVETGEIMSVQLKREKLLEHFANRAGCLISMEACGGAQQWARVGQLDEQVAEIERRLRAWHTYLRTLLIHGARSVIVNSKQPSAWVTNLTQRRAANVAVVALANKMARTIWALLAHERAFQKGYVSQPV